MYCKNCGNEIKENENFCGKCGAKVEKLQYLEHTTPLANDSNREEARSKNRKHKLSFYFFTIAGIVCAILFCIAIIQDIINNNKTYTDNIVIENVTQNNNTMKDDNQVLPIYIGKTYISKSSDLTYYITFTSTKNYKYVAKDNHGIIDDIVLYGTYEIDNTTIKTTTKINSVMSRDTYTIIDKNTIKSTGGNATIYTVSDN